MQASRLTLLLLGCLASVAQGITGTGYGEDRCTVYPDPHFHTFDGVYYDFHWSCEYDLVVKPDFLAQVSLFHQGGASFISLIGGVAFQDTDLNTLSFEGTTSVDVYYNGVSPAVLPLTMSHTSGPIDVGSDGGTGFWLNFTVTGDSIHIMQFYGSWSVEVNSVGSTGAFWGGEGLCGKYDDDLANDHTVAGGGVIPVGSPQTDIDNWALTWSSGAGSLFQSAPCTPEAPTPWTFGGDRDGEPNDDNPDVPFDVPVLHAEALAECVNNQGCGTEDECRACAKDIVERKAAASCQQAADDPELFHDCKEDVFLTGDVTWANNPVYAKPMRCRQDCDCTEYHPKARCLDRALLGHKHLKGVCPDDRCICNVPIVQDPLCVPNPHPNPFARRNPGERHGMCLDNGCKEKGGQCRHNSDKAGDCVCAGLAEEPYKG